MYTVTRTLFKAFFDICLLRIGPQDLPKSTGLLTICLIAYTFINFVLAWYAAPLLDAVLASIIETALVALITFGIVKLNRHPERWSQTLMALSGTGFIIGLVALPLIYGGAVAQNDQLLQAVILFMYVLLITWNVLVMAHILRHAMDTAFGFGIVFALTYIFITSLFISILLPELRG
ncbi:MAG: hypothetical protein HW411_1486 [Gammaproteobacteria bacterium]|nr:hypothetical protein [Gammaproteobacteria bacterium]